MKKILIRIFSILLFPIKYVFNKIVQLFEWFYSSRFLGLIFIVGIPNLLVVLLSGFFVINLFTDPFYDTTKYTNFGFAIFISLASVSFSWVKSLNQKEGPIMISKIKAAAENSLYSGILFLISSLIKFSTIKLNEAFPIADNIFSNIGWLFLVIIYVLTFTLSLIKAQSSITKLNSVLYNRLNSNIRE